MVVVGGGKEEEEDEDDGDDDDVVVIVVVVVVGHVLLKPVTDPLPSTSIKSYSYILVLPHPLPPSFSV